MDDLPSSFGKYFLTEKIATGGMAEIFLAKLIGPGGFEKPLIIKQIHPELSGEPQFVDMFVTEAKILVSLSHGHIVPVYELGVVDDTYFIAMEYIDGPTLRMVQKALARDRAAMAPACAGFILAKVLEGLDYAHRKGVIHRDLSPHNVMVSREGEVKLVDFGIAVREEQLARARGKLVGSYPYMSPEQVRGLELTPRSDLFSAGILLWELLAGASLFRRADADQTLRAVESAAIEPPSARNPDVPAELERACLRALERDPGERFDSAGSFLAVLNRYLYACEQPAGAVDLARMVARLCPPEVARPADVDASGPRPAGAGTEVGGEAEAEPERTRPLARRADDAPGEHTRPLPGRARGKRAPTVRTFATRREFKEILERATPLFPLAAITEEEVASPDADAADADADADADAGGNADADAGGDADADAAADAAADADADADAAADDADADADAAAAARGRRAFLVIAGGGLVALGALAWLFLGANEPARRDLGLTADASALVSVAPGRARDAAPPAVDASWPDAAAVDASWPDAAAARVKPTRPAREDAGARVEPGTLKVGANPWGEVYLDGRLLGRAPNSWPVPPGRHTVEVRFPVAGREQEQRFPVDIRPGQETSLGIVDFSAGPRP